MAASPEPQKRELSRPVTVALASVGSVVAAIVVSKIWGPGTLIGAAATPVIITLVAEALRKPVETVAVRTPTGTTVHDVGAPRPRAGEEPTTLSGPAGAPPSRRGLKFALVTGLIAFVIGAFVLTSTELIFGDSAASGAKTTLFSKKPSSSSSKEKEERVTTTTQTTTETTPAPTTSTETGTGAAPAPTTPQEETPTFTEEAPAAPAPGATGPTGATVP